MIDAHLHVWDHSRSSYAWLANAPEALRPNHSLEQAQAALGEFGFDRSILVQADETMAETEYLLELAAAHENIAGAVCYLPLQDSRAVRAALVRLREDALFVGVRNLTHDRPDPDWILGAEQRASLAILEAAAVPLDYLSTQPRHLENLDRLAVEHPGLTFVLDHLGNPPVGRPADLKLWEDGFQKVAEHSNVVAKLSGLYRADGAGALSPDDMDWVMSTALAAFGADRLLMGSDWPVCDAVAGAAATLQVLTEAVNALGAPEAEAVRSGTAARVYSLR